MHQEKRQFRLSDDYQSVEAPNTSSTHPRHNFSVTISNPTYRAAKPSIAIYQDARIQACVKRKWSSCYNKFLFVISCMKIGVDLHCDWRDDKKPPTLPGRACIIG
ncbi:hypothetical protein COCVIDRAFT_18341 [Bipolaris victoriae FI3]|uniref:Uncharacterized protein n=1 Tax=Bipolaris victoriae (strain FI3) TaxID=930091 RepID=W7E7X3_BIPV3|nr:hypothetical protein COCVIDRAFT_18341 [Bipolaris victoriae FI3]